MAAKKRTTKKATTRKQAAGKKAPARRASAKKAASKKGVAKTTDEKRMSALDAAAKVLGQSKEPLTTKVMVEKMSAKGFWSSPGGKTPHATVDGSESFRSGENK